MTCYSFSPFLSQLPFTSSCCLRALPSKHKPFTLRLLLYLMTILGAEKHPGFSDETLHWNELVRGGWVMRFLPKSLRVYSLWPGDPTSWIQLIDTCYSNFCKMTLASCYLYNVDCNREHHKHLLCPTAGNMQPVGHRMEQRTERCVSQ